MFTLLHLLSYAGGIAAFLFVTLSLASGLLWLAELIEEHSRYAKVVGMRAIYAVIGLHVLLYLVDGFPLLLIAFSILCHIVYLSNFSASWPYISLTSAKFLLSCCLVVADHFLWFFHFAAKAQEAKRARPATKYRYGQQPLQKDAGPTFMDVAAFFGICVWLVPLFLFLSLSANDNALPSFDNSAPPSPTLGPPSNTIDLTSSPRGGRPNRLPGSSKSLVKTIISPVFSLLPSLRGRRRGADEGLIAPRTPIRSTPHGSGLGTPQSYFPWNGSSGEGSMPGTPSGASYGNLGLDSGSRRPMGTTPPPPRRVQSEAQMSSSVNPRTSSPRVLPGSLGISEEPTQMGLPDAGFSSGTTGLGLNVDRLGVTARKSPARPSSPLAGGMDVRRKDD